MIEPSKPTSANSKDAGDENKSPCKENGLGMTVQKTCADGSNNACASQIDTNSDCGSNTSELFNRFQLLMAGVAIGFIFGIIFCAIIWNK